MSVLKKPIITEKMTKAGEKLGQYGFIVDYKANKIQIKQAIKDMYNVTVETVNTMRVPGKIRTRYTKTGFTKGSTGAYKKAVVTLRKGESIDFYSNI
jgi:large subunit ribosomal protein L23